MPHQNTVFHQLLQYIQWQRFDALAKEYGHEQTARTFKPRHHMVSLLNGALSGVQGLRATVTTVSLDAARMYHAGGTDVKRTTLADANRERGSHASGRQHDPLPAAAPRPKRAERHHPTPRIPPRRPHNIDAQTVPRQSLQTATDTQRSKAGKTRFSGNIL